MEAGGLLFPNTTAPGILTKVVFPSSSNWHEMQTFRGAFNFSFYPFEEESLQVLEMLSNRLL